MRKRIYIVSLVMFITSIMIAAWSCLAYGGLKSYFGTLHPIFLHLQENGLEWNDHLFMTLNFLLLLIVLLSSTIFGIGMLIYTFFIYQDRHCDVFQFHKQKLKYIFYIIFCFIEVYFALSKMFSIESIIFKIFGMIIIVNCLVSCILLLVEMIQNHKESKKNLKDKVLVAENANLK